MTTMGTDYTVLDDGTLQATTTETTKTEVTYTKDFLLSQQVSIQMDIDAAQKELDNVNTLLAQFPENS